MPHVSVLIFHGSHDSKVDFPIVSGVASKYPTVGQNDIIINFEDGDSFCLPEIYMHYLDDVESLGWEHGWKAPELLVSKILAGGKFDFTNWQQGEEEDVTQYTGYLTRASGAIVDSHYGKDAPTKAEFADLSPEFLRRMNEIYEGYKRVIQVKAPKVERVEVTSDLYNSTTNTERVTVTPDSIKVQVLPRSHFDRDGALAMQNYSNHVRRNEGDARSTFLMREYAKIELNFPEIATR